MTASKSARPSPAPAWLPFARKLLHRLREPTGEALPDPELAAELGLASAPAALTPRTLLTALRLAASLGGQAAVTAALDGTDLAATALLYISEDDSVTATKSVQNGAESTVLFSNGALFALHADGTTQQLFADAPGNVPLPDIRRQHQHPERQPNERQWRPKWMSAWC